MDNSNIHAYLGQIFDLLEAPLPNDAEILLSKQEDAFKIMQEAYENCGVPGVSELSSLLNDDVVECILNSQTLDEVKEVSVFATTCNKIIGSAYDKHNIRNGEYPRSTALNEIAVFQNMTAKVLGCDIVSSELLGNLTRGEQVVPYYYAHEILDLIELCSPHADNTNELAVMNGHAIMQRVMLNCGEEGFQDTISIINSVIKDEIDFLAERDLKDDCESILDDAKSADLKATIAAQIVCLPITEELYLPQQAALENMARAKEVVDAARMFSQLSRPGERKEYKVESHIYG